MADFENFESTGEANVEEDPAAEFLAREQNELAGLEDDNFAIEEASQPTEAPADNGFNAFEESTPAPEVAAEEAPQVSVETDLIEPVPEVEVEPQPSPTSFIDTIVDSEEPPQEPPQVSVETALIEPEPEVEPPVETPVETQVEPQVEVEPQPTPPSLIDTIVSEEPLQEPPQTNGPTDGGGYAAIAQADKHRQEPEKIRIWREEQKKRLEQKDAEEEVKNGQWREAAKKELEDWLKHHVEQLVKTKENNRHSSDIGSDEAQEEASSKERDETIAGQEYEKICRLCDFNPKHSKNTKDVSRMRSILLQLKQTPLVR